MKTDQLFRELLRFSLESLLELVRLNAFGPYRFESVTVKSTEKRFDGYFKNVGENGPDIFLCLPQGGRTQGSRLQHGTRGSKVTRRGG